MFLRNEKYLASAELCMNLTFADIFVKVYFLKCCYPLVAIHILIALIFGGSKSIIIGQFN